jgi:Family of unknown function (DUF6519)/Right handed beta helix region
LLLDADFNELVAVLDRRLRAETCDLTSFGPDPDHHGVAWVPRQTPDAFRVELTGGKLTIGRGRMYVDGLLAENHGVEPDGFDPLLSEVTGTADTPYHEQPYWNTPTPDPLPEAGTYLAYLDVWQREVTHLEDPELVEIAVGVDATARRQTAWQVRLLEVPVGTTCQTDDDDVPGWLEIISPSDGRVTTDTVDVGEDDPCELPPVGGYRGLENQTYRVEIHEGGDPQTDTVTFKWSRENASVAVPVVEMVSPTVLRLASVGKDDDLLRIKTNDWVEIVDDDAEYNGAPGAIRKVTVDDAERTITFADPLPAELQPADAKDAADRHFRARRWDQRGVVRDATGTQLTDLDAAAASGLIEVPASDATQVVLEHGVVVSFSVAQAGGRFRRGDHWIFHARTTDASIDLLDSAPPHGVHHHYARLGILTFPGTETSCRRLWPPLPTDGGESCDCTVCVTPESHSSGVLTLQAAVELVKELGGGTICLQAGVYDIGPGVDIDGARSLRIRGQGPATILTARGEALTITSSFAVTVENLAIVSGAAARGAVRLRGVILGTLQELAILSFGSPDGGGAAIELGGVEVLVSVRRNVLIARTGVGVPGGDDIGLFAASLRIDDNVGLAFDRGIDLGGASVYLYDCRVSGNDILGPGEAAIIATGAVAPGGSLDIVANKLATRGAGIVVGADALVGGNTVNTWGEGRGTDGIVVGHGPFAVQPGDVRITGNRVNARAGTGIALRTAVRTFMVKQNVLDGVGHGIAMEAKGRAERVAVENNEVFDVGVQGDSLGFGVGISVNHVTSAAVVGNTVARVGTQFAEGAELGGIIAIATQDVRISGNLVEEFGPQEGGSVGAFGIAVGAPFEQASVSDNAVRFRPDRRAPADGQWVALLIQSVGEFRTRMAEKVSAVPVENGAVVFADGWAFAASKAAEHVGVVSNTLAGGGTVPAGLVRVSGDVVAESNQCVFEALDDPSAVVLRGSSVVASSNRLRGERSMLILEVDENRFSAVGNLAPGGTHLGGPGGGLPGPWQPLNPDVS